MAPQGLCAQLCGQRQVISVGHTERNRIVREPDLHVSSPSISFFGQDVHTNKRQAVTCPASFPVFHSFSSMCKEKELTYIDPPIRSCGAGEAPQKCFLSSAVFSREEFKDAESNGNTVENVGKGFLAMGSVDGHASEPKGSPPVSCLQSLCFPRAILEATTHGTGSFS